MVQTAMMGKLPYTALRDAGFTHTAMADGLGPLFGRVPTRTHTSAIRNYPLNCPPTSVLFVPKLEEVLHENIGTNILDDSSVLSSQKRRGHFCGPGMSWFWKQTR